MNNKVVVITGSSRGIGFGLADSFLKLGCSVAVSSRSKEAVGRAVQKLVEGNPDASTLGVVCDVTHYDQVMELWDAVTAHFGTIDIWINNAGISNRMTDFPNLDHEAIRDVIDTNILGALYGSQVALRGFKTQGYGSLYNLEGLGSDGRRKVKGLALYGTTKAALHYFNEALIKESEGGRVHVGSIQPGMVATDMITKQYENKPPEDWKRAKRFLSILSDRVETVAPWIARRVLESQRNGTRITRSSSWRLIYRFITAPFSHRNVFD